MIKVLPTLSYADNAQIPAFLSQSEKMRNDDSLMGGYSPCSTNWVKEIVDFLICAQNRIFISNVQIICLFNTR